MIKSFQYSLYKKNINLFTFSSLSFIISIIIGVGSVTGINSYKNSLKNSILKESKKLMGADISFEASQQFSSEDLNEIITSLPEGSKYEQSVQFGSMLGVIKNNESILSMIKANSLNYPFYGKIITIPENAYSMLKEDEVLLESNIVNSLDIVFGDKVQIGNAIFKYSGQIITEPISGSGGFSGMAPASIIRIESLVKTELIQRGSRIKYYLMVELPNNIDSNDLKQKLFSKFIKKNITLLHHTEVGSGTQKFIYSTIDYIMLLGLSAFFLGSISILITVRSRLQSKINEIAILKCLGADSKFSIKLFISEIMFLSIIGSLIGIISGYFIQFMIPSLSGSELLLQIRPSLDFNSLIWGLLIGILIPLFLTLDSIYNIIIQSPIGAIRSETENQINLNLKNKKMLYIQIIVIYLIFFLITYVETNKFFKAFLLSLILVILPFLIYIFYWIIRKIFNYILKSGLISGTALLVFGKISKTGNGLSLPIIGIGSALSIIMLSIIIRGSIINLGGWDFGEVRANMFIMDIKPDQLESVDNILRKFDVKEKYISSTIGARLKKINNSEINKEDLEQDALNRDWKSTAKTREYLLSVREELYSTEVISKGKFWARDAINEISVEKDFASSLGVKIGDKLEFNIQGIDISGTITNTREVNWSDMKPNFVVIFSRGDLEKAPSNYISSFYLDNNKRRYELQKLLTKSFPNLTIFDIEKTISSLNSIFLKINSIINLMTFFLFCSSLLLLFSSLYLQEKDRKQETALYKIVGAGPKFLIKMYLIEAITVSIYSFFSSALLAIIANYFISNEILKIAYKLPILEFIYVFLLASVVILIIYIVSIWRIIFIPPKKYLSSE